jgi:hypothetical protein
MRLINRKTKLRIEQLERIAALELTITINGRDVIGPMSLERLSQQLAMYVREGNDKTKEAKKD